MLRIYVSTFNKKCYSLKSYMLPIEVGAAARKEFTYDLKDNTGDNISAENDYYGELTGLYWIWKNSDLKPTDYVGFYHYNKHFTINEKQALEELKNNDFLVLYTKIERCFPLRENQRYYDLVAKEYSPEFYEYFKKSLHHKQGDTIYTSGGNMMITTKEKFDEYYSFLFPMLKRLRELTGDDESSPYYKRYCAFFAEQAFQPYLQYKKYKFEPCELKFVGPLSWKINSFLIRAINKFLPFDFAAKHDMYIRRSGYKK